MMEKMSSIRNSDSARNKKLKISLPKINNENVPQNSKNGPSPEKIHQLKKAYYQYRSNARIIEKSPYCSSQNKRQILSLIKQGRNQEKKEEKNENKIIDLREKGEEDHTCEIELFYKGKMYIINTKAETSGELGQLLLEMIKKIQKENFSTKRQKNIFKQVIIGFETFKENLCHNFILSYPNFRLDNHEFQLKPVYKKNLGKKIRLTDFKIVKCLGSGGFSTVYLAKGLFNNVYYALKLINKQFILETDRDGIISNERFILGELHSPFVTELQFAFETLNHFVFAIQYCPGGELFNQLKKVKKMNEEQAKFYFLQILIGLDYIHSQNIVYRDLKPENLLIDAEGHVKIADFGLSKPVVNSRTYSYSFCGSPEYMAPQMLLKKGHNFLLDYYCLGALLYELVVGVPPFYSTNQQQIHEAILTEELSFPSHARLSDQLINLLQGLLLKEMNQRLGCLYGVKQILFHPWIGKISKKSIEERKLIPPFVPNLQVFNFDLDEIKADTDDIMKKLEEDQKMKKFSTCFSNEFYYEKPTFRQTVVTGSMMKKNTKHQKKTTHLHHSLEKSERRSRKKKSPGLSSLRKSVSTIMKKIKL